MLDFKAVVDHLRPLRRRDIRVELSAQTSVSGSAAAPEVRGTLTVNQGLVLLNNLDVGGSITTLPISEVSPAWAKAGYEPPTPAVPQGKKNASSAAIGPASTAPASGGNAGLLDLRIVIPGRFVVEGFGLKSEWKADMHGNPDAGFLQHCAQYLKFLVQLGTPVKCVLRVRGQRDDVRAYAHQGDARRGAVAQHGSQCAQVMAAHGEHVFGRGPRKGKGAQVSAGYPDGLAGKSITYHGHTVADLHQTTMGTRKQRQQRQFATRRFP